MINKIKIKDNIINASFNINIKIENVKKFELYDKKSNNDVILNLQKYCSCQNCKIAFEFDKDSLSIKNWI